MTSQASNINRYNDYMSTSGQLHTHIYRRQYKTRSSATAKSTARPSCLVGVYFMTFLRRKSADG